MTSKRAELKTFYDGWANYQRLLLDAIRPLSDEQVQVRPAPHQWAVWQLAAHMAGARAHWFGVLGEGSKDLRDMFRVEQTTIPDVSLEDAGWEDDLDHPRTAAELVGALDRTWQMIDECLQRWTGEDLQVEFSRQRPSRPVQTFTRQWVIWHLMEHDLHHGGEISNILGTNGIPALNL